MEETRMLEHPNWLTPVATSTSVASRWSYRIQACSISNLWILTKTTHMKDQFDGWSHHVSFYEIASRAVPNSSISVYGIWRKIGLIKLAGPLQVYLWKNFLLHTVPQTHFQIRPGSHSCALDQAKTTFITIEQCFETLSVNIVTWSVNTPAIVGSKLLGACFQPEPQSRLQRSEACFLLRAHYFPVEKACSPSRVA